jgi:hypothetical protein
VVSSFCLEKKNSAGSHLDANMMDCTAYDDVDRNSIHLTDSQGCLVQSGLTTPFYKMRETSEADGDSTVLYTYLQVSLTRRVCWTCGKHDDEKGAGNIAENGSFGNEEDDFEMASRNYRQNITAIGNILKMPWLLTHLTNHNASRYFMVPPDHLLLNSAPNLGPLISRCDINKFENC